MNVSELNADSQALLVAVATLPINQQSIAVQVAYYVTVYIKKNKILNLIAQKVRQTKLSYLSEYQRYT